MTQTAINLVGYAGAVCNAVSFVPQLLRVIRLRSARDISYSTFVIFVVGAAFWVTYGIQNRAWPVIAANGALGLLSGIIFVLKVRYDRADPLMQGAAAEQPLAAVAHRTGTR